MQEQQEKRKHVRKPRKGGNGRWTEEEHKLFLEGLVQYDNDWGRVQRHVKTRSSNQIRSHAQKFFLRISKSIEEKEEKEERERLGIAEPEQSDKEGDDALAKRDCGQLYSKSLEKKDNPVSLAIEKIEDEIV